MILERGSIQLMTRYLLRLDDASHTMKKKNWDIMLNACIRYGVKALIGVIPKNEDTDQYYDLYDDNFWIYIRELEKSGFEIAMHGYNHKYIYSNEGAFLSFNKKSEFCGCNLLEQKDKINKSYCLFQRNGIRPRIFIAPSHTFNDITLRAISEETEIKIISDTFAFYPYKEKGFYFIPQQLWRYREMPFGIWTICIHPNMMTEKDLESTINEIKNKRIKYIPLDYDLNSLCIDRPILKIEKMLAKFWEKRLIARNDNNK
jgi:predicted deacetylase